MKHICFALFAIFFCSSGFSADKNVPIISHILAIQADAWNKGDIDAYMHAGYWNSDSLIFIGKSGPTYGFKATLERYKSSYSDATKMGKLNFSELQIKPISAGCYFVIGKWELKRSIGDLAGYFTLLFRKINGKWRIVCDHSS